MQDAVPKFCAESGPIFLSKCPAQAIFSTIITFPLCKRADVKQILYPCFCTTFYADTVVQVSWTLSRSSEEFKNRRLHCFPCTRLWTQTIEYPRAEIYVYKHFDNRMKKKIKMLSFSGESNLRPAPCYLYIYLPNLQFTYPAS